MDEEEATETFAAELELIAAMYGEDMTPTAESGCSVVLRPQETGQAQRFVEATLQLHASIPMGYPTTAATVKLVRTRGLLDEEEAALLEAVTAKAAECADNQEPSLFALLECASEQLTAYNAGGVCPVCRDPLFEPAEPGGAPRAVFLSTCFHNFHAACLGGWWHACTAGVATTAKAGEAPSRGAASRAEATAAAATARELRAKVSACADNVDAISARHALLRALVAEDGVPRAAELRKVQEESKDATTELGRLEVRAAKAEKRAEELCAQADALVEAEAAAASEAERSAPLPCPACRAEISAASLVAGGVSRAPPTESFALQEAPQLSAAQVEAQRERQRLWERQQRRQGGLSAAASAPVAETAAPVAAQAGVRRPTTAPQRAPRPPPHECRAPPAEEEAVLDADRRATERALAQMTVAAAAASSGPPPRVSSSCGVPPNLLQPGLPPGLSSLSAAEETRMAPDGNRYSKAEFHSFFGGLTEWEEARTQAAPADIGRTASCGSTSSDSISAASPSDAQHARAGGGRRQGRGGRGRTRAGAAPLGP